MEQETRRVLVVDDEPAILKLVQAVLTRNDFQVVGVANASQALKALEERGPFDCVVTDALMPRMSGFDLTRTIRENSKFGSVPVIILTRKRDRADVKRALSAGASDYVLKPIDEHLLVSKIEQLIKKSGKKPTIFQIETFGEQGISRFSLPCTVVTISEAGMTVRFPIEPSESLLKMDFQFHSQIFEQIGIEVPHVRAVDTREIPEEKIFESRFTFVGVSEADLRKIRVWLQKESIRRKKT